MNNRVIVAGTRAQEEFLRGEASGFEFIELFGYNVRYSNKLPVSISILMQYPRLRAIVKKENEWLRRFMRSDQVDVVISDNRYGLHHQDAECVFITHQLNIPAPFLRHRVNEMNRRFINSFDQCWVPDHAEMTDSLAGELSHPAKGIRKAEYIGPLSRFSAFERKAADYDVLILLSGVEPQRSELERKLIAALGDGPLRVACVRGTASGPRIKFPENFSVIGIANTQKLLDLVGASDNIICRSGYSTLMDLHALGRRAILVPTPGQAEQEYLASFWEKQFGFRSMKQNAVSAAAISCLLSPAENPALQTRSA